MPEPGAIVERPAGPARPSGFLAADPVIAVDLGATHTRVAAVLGPSDSAGVVVFRTAELARMDGQGVVPGLVEAIRKVAGATAGATVPMAIGVAVAAYVDHSGVVLQPRPFGIPGGSAIRDRIAEAFGVPVVVDNDANLAALAEATIGAARGLSNVAVITLGTNIGLGIIADGRILRGAHGAAGEAGTFLVPVRRGRDGGDRYARAGRLGSGATTAPAHYAILEELVGGGALLRSISPGPAIGPPAGPGPRPTPVGIFASARAGDRRARSAVRHAIEGWAMLIANLEALLDPEAFVISGGFVEDAPAFIEPLRRRAAELCPLPPEIRIGDLGAQSGLVGAAVAARSIVRSQAAEAAASDVPDSSNQGRASGHLSREVER
jgi:glucokinase